MKISQEGINLIKQFEGCKLKAYRDPIDIWTIGYGHTAGVKEGMTITQAQADSFLKKDIEKYEKYVNTKSYCPFCESLNNSQFDALVSFTYNCGPGNLKKLCNSRTIAEIPAAMLLYNKAAGIILPGLTRRRKAEAALFIKEGEPMQVPNYEEQPQVTGKLPTSYFPKSNYKGYSIIDALVSVHSPWNYAYRKKIAAANGVKNYTGTATQNLKLLGLLQSGKLVKP